jgi:hypothetical protein
MVVHRGLTNAARLSPPSPPGDAALSAVHSSSNVTPRGHHLHIDNPARDQQSHSRQAPSSSATEVWVAVPSSAPSSATGVCVATPPSSSMGTWVGGAVNSNGASPQSHSPVAATSVFDGRPPSGLALPAASEGLAFSPHTAAPTGVEEAVGSRASINVAAPTGRTWGTSDQYAAAQTWGAVVHAPPLEPPALVALDSALWARAAREVLAPMASCASTMYTGSSVPADVETSTHADDSAARPFGVPPVSAAANGGNGSMSGCNGFPR